MSLSFPAMALVRRELMTSLRRTRSFLLLLAFLVCAMVLVLNIWPSTDRLFVQAQQIGLEIVSSLCFLLFGASLLFVPALASGAIALEREQDTLDLLLSTLIRPRSLVLGKLLNAVGFFLLIVLSALPVMGVTFFLVGLDWRDIGRAMLILVSSSAACGAVGILSSAWFRRPYAAITCSYLGVLILQLAGPVFGFFAVLAMQPFNVRLPSLEQVLVDAFAVGSPLGALRAVFEQQLTLFQLISALVYQLAATILCLWLARRAMRRAPAPPRIETFKPIDDPLVLKARRNTFPYYLVDPLRRKKPVEDNINPMLVKELRWGLMNNAGRLIRIFYWSLGGYFLAGLPSMYASGDFESMTNFIMFQIALTLVITPALLANTLTKEYEMGNIDMLRMTLLRPRQIVVGKLLAGLTIVAPIALGAACAGLPAAFVIGQRGALLVTGYTTLTVSCLVCLCLSLAASMLTRRTATALILTYAFAALIFVGTWLSWAFTDHAMAASSVPNEPQTSGWIWFVSPPIIFAANAEGEFGHTASLINSTWLGNIAVFLIFCAFLVALSVRSFNRFRLRDT